MSEERNARGLKVALASYDVRQIRVWSRYLEEQSAELCCRGYCRGEELLLRLRQGEPFDVVVLGGQLEDMDAMTFLGRVSRLEQKPFLLLMNEGARNPSMLSGLDMGGNCYLVRQTSLRDLLDRLQKVPGDPAEKIEQACQKLYSRWGLPQPDTNCEYLTQAVQIVCTSKIKLAIRKEILRQIAEQRQMKIVAVDSGLRRLVENLEIRSPKAWKDFKSQNGLEGRSVTTGRLIYAVKNTIEQDGSYRKELP